MNVYDFDETIFFPDSSYSFVLYCLRHYPRAVLPALAGAGLAKLQHLFGQIQTRELKQQVFAFLPGLSDVDRIVADFWAENEKRIAPWYLAQRRSDDVILSASPDFLLQPIADKLGVKLIATRMDRHTGLIIGDNCHDAEKVSRFLKEYPGVQPDNFYSDSLSDSPMAWYSKQAWLVKSETERVPWPEPDYVK